MKLVWYILQGGSLKCHLLPSSRKLKKNHLYRSCLQLICQLFAFIQDWQVRSEAKTIFLLFWLFLVSLTNKSVAMKGFLCSWGIFQPPECQGAGAAIASQVWPPNHYLYHSYRAEWGVDWSLQQYSESMGSVTYGEHLALVLPRCIW